MAYMEWNQTLEVGIGQIDGDHRTLVGALNRLHEALDRGDVKEEVEKVLIFLRNYTVTHFEREESLMVEHHYPGLAGHFAAHAALVMQVSDFLSDFRTGKAVLTDDMLSFLESWLLDHILGLDKELGGFLKNRGVAA